MPASRGGTGAPPPVVVAAAWFHRRDYAAHRALDPKGLQPRYEQWLKSAQAHEKEAKRRGWTVVRVMLDPDELAAWCRARRRDVDAHARSEFAVLLYDARHGDGDTSQGNGNH